MLGSDWIGTPDDIISMIAKAGYEGAEFSNTMIGDYADLAEAQKAITFCKAMDVPLMLAGASAPSSGPDCPCPYKRC